MKKKRGKSFEGRKRGNHDERRESQHEEKLKKKAI